MTEIVLIAAVARNGVIGADNDMPWKLSTDLKRFKKMTMGKPVIMGRKTFESFGGKPLPGRPHVIISRNPEYQPMDAEKASSFDEGLKIARKLADDLGENEIWCIGGGQIYAQAIEIADRLEITEVDAEPVGDTRFPEISPLVWQESVREEAVRSERDSAEMTFVSYKRIR